MRVTHLLAATALMATPALAQNGGQDNAASNQVKPVWGMNHGRRVVTPGGQPGTVPNTSQKPAQQDGQPSEQ